MKIKTLMRAFDSDTGKRIYRRFLDCIDDFDMRPLIRRGVLLGFSGGADSVLCALLLLCLQSQWESFPLALCHVNHGIRAESAARDQAFCQEFAKALDVAFFASQIDVPKMSREYHIGIEECARKMRYEEFYRILSGRNGIATIATAHNATDNLETVFHRLLRGSGTRGMCGIPAVRENIIRPMLYLSKGDIVNFLDENNICFVTDETNEDVSYTRNYIRKEILPHLERLTDKPEESILRFVQNLREDEECLCNMAKQFLDKYPQDIINEKDFSALPRSIRSRVLREMLQRKNPSIMLERKHMESVFSAMESRFSRISLVGGYSLFCEKGMLYVASDNAVEEFDVALPINQPTYVSQLGATFVLCERACANSFANVYKNSIQVRLSSAIIKGELRLRSRRDGDSYRFSGVTHRLKTLFQSLHLLKIQKQKIPVFYDDEGIVYVPPFMVRGQNKEIPDRDADLLLLIHYPEGTAPWIDK